MLFDVRERAVVGRDDEVAVSGFRDDAASCRADAGVDHGDEHRARRPVRDGLRQAVACLPDVIGRNVVGQILDGQLRTDGIGHAVHGADRAVL